MIILQLFNAVIIGGFYAGLGLLLIGTVTSLAICREGKGRR